MYAYKITYFENEAIIEAQNKKEIVTYLNTQGVRPNDYYINRLMHLKNDEQGNLQNIEAWWGGLEQSPRTIINIDRNPNATQRTHNHPHADRTYNQLIAWYCMEYYTHPHNINYECVTQLATIISHAVLNTCIDPQRKTATQLHTTSNSGYNDYMVTAKHDIFYDLKATAELRSNADKAERNTYLENGNVKRVVVDKEAHEAEKQLLHEPLGVGLDIVNTAIEALLQVSADYMTTAKDPKLLFLLDPQPTRTPRKKILYNLSDTIDYKTTMVTPIQTAYRMVRRYIEANRNTQYTPNGFTYISYNDILQEQQTTISDPATKDVYYRAAKYADIGGYAVSSNGYTDTYNTTAADFTDSQEIVEKMKPTAKQLQVLRFRVQGLGYKAIAQRLQISADSVRDSVRLLQKKAMQCGYHDPDRNQLIIKFAENCDALTMVKIGKIEKIYDGVNPIGFSAKPNTNYDIIVTRGTTTTTTTIKSGNPNRQTIIKL